MLVEGDITSLRDAESHLKINDDFKISLVQSIEEAFILQNQDSYDVIISEQNLSSEKGLSFLKKIRANDDQTPFIFFTLENSVEFIKGALNHGANFLLSKEKMNSETFSELSRMIRSCYDSKNKETNLTQHHRVTQNMDAALLIFQFDGLENADNLRLIDMNPAAKKIIDWDNAIGTSLTDLNKNPNYGSILEKIQQKCPSTGLTQLDNFQMPDSAGTLREYSVDVMRIPQGFGAIIQDITNEKQAHRELAEREEMFRLITENTGENITLMDLDFKVSFTNSSILKIRGFTAEEVLNQSIHEILTPDSIQKIMKILEEQMELERKGADSNRRIVVDLEEYHKDGSILLLENTITFYRDADLKPKGFITVSRDITEKKRNEEKLRHSYDLLNYIISHTSSGIAVNDRDLRYTYVSERFLKEYGLTGQNVIGRHIYEVFPDLPEKWKDIHQRVLNGEVLQSNKDPYTRADGSVLWTRWECRPWYESEGTIGGFIIYSEVINEQMERELALKESRNQMKQIIENLPDPTMVISKDGVVTHWNKSMKNLTGVRSEEIVGQGDYAYSIPFFGERRPMLADVVRGAWTDYASSYDRLRNEGDILTVDAAPALSYGQKIMVWANARPLYDAQGMVMGAIQSIRDVTEMVQVTETLLRVNKQLSLMSHLARHDMLNQIMVINGYLELMREMIDNPEILKLFSRLELSASKIKEHIEFTHIYHGIGAQEPVWQRLSEIVPSSSDLDITLKTDIEGLEIFADAMLKSVFGNLLENSLSHGEHVSEITLTYSQNAENLVIIWEDNGKGIPPELKPRIFERGFGSNTGLGLFLITEILDITEIDISENGEFGKGARFELRVPSKNYRWVQPFKESEYRSD